MTDRSGLVLAKMAALLAAVLCLSVYPLLLTAVDFDAALLEQPAAMIELDRAAILWLERAMLADMLGFYLLQIPIAIFLHLRLRANPVMNYATVFGVGYCLIGAIGAAALSVAWPTLSVLYQSAPDEAARIALRDSFTMISAVVNLGLWGRAEFLLGALWWICIGFAADGTMRAFRMVSWVLGVATALAWLGNLLSTPLLAEPALMAYMGLVPVWLITMVVSVRSPNA